MTNIPNADGVTASWLTHQLRAAGHKNARVRGYTQQTFGTGQVGKCVRFRLDLDPMSGDAPASVVGKFPSDNELSRNTAVALGIYEREVWFYRELAPRLSIDIPKCYYADIDGADFLILMEDMHPAEQGDQMAGCSAEVARVAVLELPGLQAPTWCDAALADHLRPPPDDFFADMHARYNEMLPGFLARLGPRLADDERHMIERVAASAACPLFQPVGEPYCVEHRDYRLDNLLINEQVVPPRVTVVDWQGMRMGRPLNDVALCLGGGLEPSVRRSVEENIVRAYHQGLLRADVEGFDWAQCWHAYRCASFAGFGLTIIATMVVEQTDRGDAMFTAMAKRYARTAIDLGVEDLLD